MFPFCLQKHMKISIIPKFIIVKYSLIPKFDTIGFGLTPKKPRANCPGLFVYKGYCLCLA